MEKKFDVIGFGDPFQDLDIQLSRLPETNVNMRMNDYCFMGGGNVPTAMVAAARLGLKSSILGVVGDDMLGRLATADFTYNHVDTSHLKVAAGKRTNFCLCVAEQEIDGKEFISKPGDFDPLTPSDLDKDYIQSAKALHIGQFTPAIVKACEWMHEAGGVVSIDAAYYRPDIYENYRHLDIFIGSEMYYNVMCQTEGYTGGRADIRRVLRAIQSQGPKTVIFTFGADGCIGLCGDEFFEVPAFKVKAVDSTGAGDVFHGAYIYAWLQGWDAKTCCRFCSGVSAIKCTRPGGRSGIPTLPILEKFLATGEIDGTELDERVQHYKYGLLNA